MSGLESKIQHLKFKLRGGLIVSCQAPENSPLRKPEIIAAFAETAEQNGAIGVRIDSPAHISAVKARVSVPVIGIYKIVSPTSEVYITPTFESAQAICASGADLIAVDATARPRPNDEDLRELVARIKKELQMPIMADAATLAEGVHAIETCGAHFVGTTLSGYTNETRNKTTADFALVEQLSKRLSVPIICEGKLKSPQDVRRAFDAGAFAVVVGGAITGVDNLVQEFVAAAKAD